MMGISFVKLFPKKARRPRISCSMKITEDVRKYAAEQRITEEAAIEKGLKQKATKFNEAGAEIYAKT